MENVLNEENKNKDLKIKKKSNKRKAIIIFLFLFLISLLSIRYLYFLSSYKSAFVKKNDQTNYTVAEYGSVSSLYQKNPFPVTIETNKLDFEYGEPIEIIIKRRKDFPIEKETHLKFSVCWLLLNGEEHYRTIVNFCGDSDIKNKKECSYFKVERGEEMKIKWDLANSPIESGNYKMDIICAIDDDNLWETKHTIKDFTEFRVKNLEL